MLVRNNACRRNHIIGGTVIYKLLEDGPGVLGLVQSYFIYTTLEWEIIMGEIKLL